MKYSIIVTGYNCEKYAKQCIDSILAQTFTDYEIIIINDCSTDNTKEILESYKQQKELGEPWEGQIELDKIGVWS